MSIIVQTPRVFIREFLPEEQEIYLNHFTDEKVALYLPKRDREERINIFNNALNQYPITKTIGVWGIFNKANGEFIGSCLLRPFNDGIIELGYSLEQKYWGQGIATEMAIAMTSHGLSDTNTLEIVAVTVLENLVSQRVLEKAGFKRMSNLSRNGEELAFFRVRALDK
ncbi:GNAT family N-acetyltransferase [Mucilaginibacter sp.]|uniref:GNAT family N-acetyltransferase n=1 Tax=Mucilaginibacter sp. TaxID=1882438 RepID=UPI0026312A0F|nr:GNAT family N-acetyltransferase [Mucilaginibacter sp.]MDB4925301.1 anhydro-N-acetylmuramic acid kinase [Mucilaginibacter sp.]